MGPGGQRRAAKSRGKGEQWAPLSESAHDKSQAENSTGSTLEEAEHSRAGEANEQGDGTRQHPMPKGAPTLILGAPRDVTREGLWWKMRTYTELFFVAYGLQVWFYTFLCTLVLCIFPSTRTLALTVMVVLLSGALVPFQSFQADLKWRKGRMMHDMAAYFDMECVCEVPLSGHPDTQYLLAQYPHGLFPLGPLLSSFFIDSVLSDQPLYCGVASMLTLTPFFRYLIGKLGAFALTKPNIALAKQRRASISIVVGGVHEMFLASESEELVHLRSGFIREAIKHDFHIVPVFIFGNSLLFSRWVVPVLDPIFQWVARRLYLPLIFYTGAHNLPLPCPQKLKMVIGTPIPVTQESTPSEKQVHRLYQQFKHDMTRIYDQHRPTWETRPLRFLEDKIMAMPFEEEGEGEGEGRGEDGDGFGERQDEGVNKAHKRRRKHRRRKK